MRVVRADDAFSGSAGRMNCGEMICGIDEVPRRARFPVSGPHAALYGDAVAYQKAATLVRRFLARVRHHILDHLLRDFHGNTL
jgi:hypothetical protein